MIVNPAVFILLLAGLLLAGLLYFAWSPWGIGGLSAHPRPAASYDEASQRVAALQAQEGDEHHPDCHTQLLTHGSKSPRALALVHGYTSCPQQFVPLGQLFFDRGYNVLIARLPRHGRADRMTDEHGGLTAAELAAFADEVTDIAVGLGEHVTMLGLSGGAIITAWASQNRAELDRAVIVSPAFGFKQIPAPVTAPLMNVVRQLPDAFTWWDPALRERLGPPYTYPRYSRRALAEILRLGFATRVRAGRGPAAAGSIVMVTNASDTSVDNAAAARMVTAWRAGGTRSVTQYEFPLELKLGHDLIDPAQPDARPEVVYPKLLELVDVPVSEEHA